VIRDTAIYSILDTEWGVVKQNLAQRLQRTNTPASACLLSAAKPSHYYVN
jgi:hypothetical protein